MNELFIADQHDYFVEFHQQFLTDCVHVADNLADVLAPKRMSAYCPDTFRMFCAL